MITKIAITARKLIQLGKFINSKYNPATMGYRLNIPRTLNSQDMLAGMALGSGGPVAFTKDLLKVINKPIASNSKVVYDSAVQRLKDLKTALDSKYGRASTTMNLKKVLATNPSDYIDYAKVRDNLKDRSKFHGNMYRASREMVDNPKGI